MSQIIIGGLFIFYVMTEPHEQLKLGSMTDWQQKYSCHLKKKPIITRT